MNMKNYNRRGMYWLASFICILLVGAVLCAFSHTRYVGIALIIVSPIVNLPAFIAFRKMTPEKFEKQQRQERIANDERNQRIGARTCQIAILVICVSLCLGAVVAMIFENNPAILANLGQLVILSISILIVNSILNKKM